MTGVDMIAEEYQRRRDDGFTAERDRRFVSEELSRAGACYALPANKRGEDGLRGPYRVPRYWPWAEEFWQPRSEKNSGGVWTREDADERIGELCKAGALIAAEIDRLSSVARADHR